MKRIKKALSMILGSAICTALFLVLFPVRAMADSCIIFYNEASDQALRLYEEYSHDLED